jgi:putative nucleotidyltransferase with HDIG domain
MTRLQELHTGVARCYAEKRSDRADWADWIYDNHVVTVTAFAKNLAKRFGADAELSQAAAMLHDIADYTMKRENPRHAEESMKIARTMMSSLGYSSAEIALVVDDAIRFHGCYDNQRPKSTEGLILATADALAHLQTDFYLFAARYFDSGASYQDLKQWVLKKAARDFNNKIAFAIVREEARPDYDMVRRFFSR